ncbi:STAS domain-containing protein [Paragemmobacter straminiformis]|uniref:Anti-sigma factor antagonist n=1 Tax=Paragemmobacter straminiformis TaxID=2045119 RepID=A0A842ID56_9RHOB|nr:STAS domain-containing protein [Gemmobacter straminiformis]MBC2837446.1 STAS domain-containing protein [Gemmobacter straminiformis]
MTFSTRNDKDVVIVETTFQRLDASLAPALRAALLAPVDAGATSLVLDLSGVSFVDSSALGALIAAAKRLAAHRGFAVAGVQPAVARLFALTHMERVFSIHPDTGEAIARLST